MQSVSPLTLLAVIAGSFKNPCPEAISFWTIVAAWALNYGVNQKALPKITMDNKVLQEKLRILAKDLTQNVDKTYYIFGGVYAVLGLLAIGVPMFVHRGKGGHLQFEHVPETPEPVHYEAPVEHRPEPPKKPPKNIKVQ